MARRNNGGGEEEGGNWMDTYGDMITLVLTFFVLLYSFSSTDQAKWQIILQAFSSGGDHINIVVDEEEAVKETAPGQGEYNSDVESSGEVMASIDKLYTFLTEYIDEHDMNESITVEKGEANVYLKFRDNVFFDGDSSYLLDDGKQVLEDIAPAIKEADDAIQAIRIAGHTAEGKFSVVDEWDLSAARANSVLKYLVYLEASTPDKMSATGYAKYRPVASNETEDTKKQNRRVEIVIIRSDVDWNDPAVIRDFYELEFGQDIAGQVVIDPDEPEDTAETEPLPEETEPVPEETEPPVPTADELTLEDIPLI